MVTAFPILHAPEDHIRVLETVGGLPRCGQNLAEGSNDRFLRRGQGMLFPVGKAPQQNTVLFCQRAFRNLLQQFLFQRKQLRLRVGAGGHQGYIQVHGPRLHAFCLLLPRILRKSKGGVTVKKLDLSLQFCLIVQIVFYIFRRMQAPPERSNLFSFPLQRFQISLPVLIRCIHPCQIPHKSGIHFAAFLKRLHSSVFPPRFSLIFFLLIRGHK